MLNKEENKIHHTQVESMTTDADSTVPVTS